MCVCVCVCVCVYMCIYIYASYMFPPSPPALCPLKMSRNNDQHSSNGILNTQMAF